MGSGPAGKGAGAMGMTRPGRLTDPETAWAPVSWGGAGSHNVLSQGADGEGQ